MPKTNLGSRSVKLLILAIMLFIVGVFDVQVLGFRGGDTIFDSPLEITIPMIGSGLSVITSFLLGLLAIVKEKERSFLVYIAVLIGFFALIFILGEFLSPH